MSCYDAGKVNRIAVQALVCLAEFSLESELLRHLFLMDVPACSLVAST